MGGTCQATWEHAVPKVAAGAGPRISASIRWARGAGAEQEWAPPERQVSPVRPPSAGPADPLSPPPRAGRRASTRSARRPGPAFSSRGLGAGRLDAADRARLRRRATGSGARSSLLVAYLLGLPASAWACCT